MIQWLDIFKKKCIKEHSDTIKQLGLEIRTLEEKVTKNEKVITRLHERVSLLECQVVYLGAQGKLKARKLEDIEYLKG